MPTLIETLCKQAAKRGHELGERDGASAKQLGMSPESSCKLSFAQHQTDSTLFWHFGITAGELTPAIEVQTVGAFMDAYRDAYTAVFADGHYFAGAA